MKAEKCPYCKGTPMFIYYSYGDKELEELNIIPKRIECSECGATTFGMYTTLDDAVRAWNYQDESGRYVFKKLSAERCD